MNLNTSSLLYNTIIFIYLNILLFGMSEVRIGKSVDYKTLETALIKAARELGWKARIEDKFEKNYELGSVKEFRDYDHTIVHLRGRLFPAMKLYIRNKGQLDWFGIWTGFPHGIASDRRVQEYLSAVFNNL